VRVRAKGAVEVANPCTARAGQLIRIAGRLDCIIIVFLLVQPAPGRPDARLHPDVARANKWETAPHAKGDSRHQFLRPTAWTPCTSCPDRRARSVSRAHTQELCLTAHAASCPDRHTRTWETMWVPVICPVSGCAPRMRLPASGALTVTHGGAPATTAAGGCGWPLCRVAFFESVDGCSSVEVHTKSCHAPFASHRRHCNTRSIFTISRYKIYNIRPK
jgi:hypothetical protein